MPYLLTPGPLTTSRAVKAAMLADWGSRDVEFRRVVAEIRKGLLDLAGADESYECVIMQGSGTFAIEAALGASARRRISKTLVVANGAYGDRAAAILTRLGRPVIKIDKGDSAAPTPEDVARALDADPAISHVWIIHCETTSGIVNPIADIARAVKARGTHLHGRCHVLLRRAAARHEGRVRRHGLLLQQMHRGRSRLLLRGGEARHAGGLQGHEPFRGARPL